MGDVDSRIKWSIVTALLVVIGASLTHYFYSKPAFSGSTSKKWEFVTTGPITGALALADDGTLYATSADGFLWALDPSGNLKWKFETGPIRIGPTLGQDGSIYVMNLKQEIYGIDPTGNLRWSSLGSSHSDTSAAGFADAIDSTDLYTLWHGQLRAVALSSGEVDWSAGVGYTDLTTVSMLPNGDMVYPGVGRFEKLDSQGQVLWHYPPIDPAEADAPLRSIRRGPEFKVQSGIAVAADGSLYAGLRDHIVAISPDGHLLWEFKSQVGVDNPATPLVARDGTIYFASQDQNLYALRSGCNLLWKVYVGGSVTATPILAEDGTIYVVSSSGGLVAVSPQGKLLDQVPVGGALRAAPTLAPDGTVYVGSESGKIFAFAGAHGGLMKSSWPKFQADLANSGRAQQD